MNKLTSLVLLAGGITLLFYVATASDFFGSGFSRFLKSSPADKTIWLLLGGAVATVFGLSGLFRGSKNP